jgi:cytochrome c-type biogenesis protein
MEIGLLLSFLAGIASVLSPCVLPLIPLVIGYSLLEQEASEVISFILGFFLVFTLIITFTVLFTAAINYYLYYFRFIAAIIIILIGILFILNKKAFKISYKPVQHGNKNIRSFLMGFLTSLAWSPCYGSYLIAVIAYSASTGNILYSTLNILLFSAGFSLTIFFISLGISQINLRKLIKYSDHIRLISGSIILISGIYMLYVLLFGAI